MILAVLVSVIPAALLAYFWTCVLADETRWPDGRACSGCPVGWCDCEPGSEKCKKQREEAQSYEK